MADTAERLTINKIVDRVKKARYHISEHVIRALMAQDVTLLEIKDALINGFIMEMHYHSGRDTGFLVLGYSEEKPVHVVCADEKDDWLIILFAYTPSYPVWKDAWNRCVPGGKPMGEMIRKCYFCGGELKEILVGSFDYRLDGKLYVLKNVPASLCQQCGEKYISAEAAGKIDEQISAGNYLQTEEVHVLEYK